MSAADLFDTSVVRHTSTLDGFPFAKREVTLLLIALAGRIAQATVVEDKRQLLEQAEDEDLVFAAWPANAQSLDLFLVDDLDQARRALN